ncbi:Sec-independent protein translocase subunit TatA [Corynebacterium parakroppenstedtii]|uniref:Sec-independent protein translocase subunit TatA n=1 Tax=Corynebacterium parakroppenstedtii TaxID=2828363 RepID=UPI001C8F3F41|nr:Sec-independent protein translocase subunit TatA [Corynebacterium parakroppenstedtii]MBY0794444.1 Sec-independent protein translocase subunit TatA [Corynebacterium parakroppenstedtii]
MANLGFPELVLIAVVILVLFGWKKLPDAARSVGRSMRIFKSEVSEMKNDGAETEKTSTAATKTDEITSSASSTDTPQPTVTVESKDEKKHPA